MREGDPFHTHFSRFGIYKCHEDDEEEENGFLNWLASIYEKFSSCLHEHV